MKASEQRRRDSFADRLDAFVLASQRYTDVLSADGKRADAAARSLASAGDRLESALREMIREEAEKLLAERFH